MKSLFLDVIEEAKTIKDFKFKLWNFCIMDNHCHFLPTPEKGQSLSMILKMYLIRIVCIDRTEGALYYTYSRTFSILFL
ncbi:MAG: transposase [Spirochaetaceae bacterium]|nr:transposase [Spirochaetaceae bacterium]